VNVARLLRIDCTVTHVTVDEDDRDEMGNPTEVTTTTTYKGWHWQSTSREETGNAETVQDEHNLALELAAAGNVDAGDRVEIDGITWEIDGEPWQARNPRTLRLEYVQAKIVRSV